MAYLIIHLILEPVPKVRVALGDWVFCSEVEDPNGAKLPVLSEIVRL